MIEIGNTVTNGAWFGDKKEPYLFRVIAIDGEWAWVRSINGTFSGDRLTFKSSVLSAAK